MSADVERITRLETRVDDLSEKTSELRGAYEHLATKDDVTNATLKIVLWLVGAAAPIWIGLGIQLFLSLKG